MRENLVNGIAEYFNTNPQWLDFIKNHLSYPDSEKELYHSHIYVDMSIHPASMHPIMYAFWAKQGYPLQRCIDPQSPKPKQGGLHGCCPTGVTNFDFFFRYNKDVVLAPMPPDADEAEHGYNALSWGKDYQNEFYKKFDFQAVGPREDAEIRAWFLSKHWKECLAQVMDPGVTHCHCNVELNFDPGVIMCYALQDLASKGWIVERVYPSVYDVHGVYQGKVVFLVGHPEKVFDICWRFNPDVTIRRATENWIFPTPGFDTWYYKGYQAVIDGGDFITLTDEEIQATIDKLEKVL